MTKAKKGAKVKTVYDCGGRRGLSAKKKTGAKCSAVEDLGGRVGLKRIKKTRVKKNPAEPSKESARDLYADFHGAQPQGVRRVRVPDLPGTMVEVGPCIGIMYETVRDGKREQYLHKFKKTARPILTTGPNGRGLYLVGGSFTFTDRGIVDK